MKEVTTEASVIIDPAFLSYARATAQQILEVAKTNRYRAQNTANKDVSFAGYMDACCQSWGLALYVDLELDGSLKDSLDLNIAKAIVEQSSTLSNPMEVKPANPRGQARMREILRDAVAQARRLFFATQSEMFQGAA